MYAVILDYIRPSTRSTPPSPTTSSGSTLSTPPGSSSRQDAPIAGDPFAGSGLATHTVYEFHPSKWTDEVGGQLGELMD
ncbi:MAG: hypothetical protein L0L26_12540 [Corynebacterium variabile]|uniref:hypothetical protein n=1 Tax=Corynebacterium variabile TaxID=1727 RepID=UPI0026480FAF|nr:hypothetical protein [Corynebacterium variabile]MDN6662651.1 hypothetical protein [Corynebacterium variabile]